MKPILALLLLGGCLSTDDPKLDFDATHWGSMPYVSPYNSDIFTQSYASKIDGGWQVSTYVGGEVVHCSDVAGINHGGMTVWISDRALLATGDVPVVETFDPTLGTIAKITISAKTPRTGTIKLTDIGSTIRGKFENLNLGPTTAHGEFSAVRCD